MTIIQDLPENQNVNGTMDLLTEDERRRRIAETAYFIAEECGLSGDNEQTLADWFRAEDIVNRTTHPKDN